MQFVFPQQKQVASQIHKTLQVFVESQGEIRPHFHLTGPSGSGKTHLLKPHWKAEADEARRAVLNHAIHQLLSLVGELETEK